MEFENVIKSFNQYKNFSEYDESEWDYFEDDDFVNETDINKMSNEEFENILEYVNSHLDEAPLLGEIEWINDVDVDVDDIKAVYEIDN